MTHLNNTSSFTHHNQVLLWATQKSLSLFPKTDTIPWTKCMKLAHHHAVIPQFYKALKDNNITAPELFMRQLASQQRNIALENMKLTAELIHITQQLDINNLPYLSIKGPALSQTLYQNITIRQICDLDILVDEKDLTRVAGILFKEGYQTELAYALLENDGYRALDNDFTFLHHQKKIMIELHWKLFPARHHMPLDFKRLYKVHIHVTLQKHKIKVLSNEENLLYLCLHASKHLFEQLKWLCDIDRLVRANPDIEFNTLYNRANELQVQEPFLVALQMSRTLYNTPLPDFINTKMTPRTDILIQKSLQYFTDDFTMLDEGNKKRLRLLFLQELNSDKQNRYLALFIYIFKPSSVDYIHYNLPKRLNFLYPLLRPIRLFRKYLLKGKI